jgi:hypothetical protein
LVLSERLESTDATGKNDRIIAVSSHLVAASVLFNPFADTTVGDVLWVFDVKRSIGLIE